MGGMICRCIAMMEITDSNAEVAPRQWPVMGLVELQGTLAARTPSSWLTALASAASFILVPVPWAFT